MKNFLLLFFSAALMGCAVGASTPLAIDNVFSDHMVVQRGKPVRFSGTAVPGTLVKCRFRGEEASACAGEDGRWGVEFRPGEAGGPFEFDLFTDRSGKAVIKDILVGDVWLCSGQSNMEMPIWSHDPHYRRLDGKEFAASFKDPNLRLLQVAKSVAVGELFTDFPARPAWKRADNPAAIEEFSFTGLSFGMALREKLGEDVPIGLVNASWGGTLIEPWIPFSAYAGDPGRYGEVVDALGGSFAGDRADYAAKMVQRAKLRQADLLEWVGRFLKSGGEASRTALADWAKPAFDASKWAKVTRRTMTGLSEPGVAWYRFEFELPEAWVGKKLVFHADYVNDADETFFDGEKIGQTGPAEMLSGYWAAPRDYAFTAKTAGRHVIAVRAQDHFSSGGLGEKLQVIELESGATIDFREFLEKVEFRADLDRIGDRPPVPSLSADSRPTCQTWTALYNTMIHPLTAMNIKGVIWYQGCSNAGNYRLYPHLQQLQINSYRRAFRDAALPFVITQLAAFKEHSPGKADDGSLVEPLVGELGFAPMREAQFAAVRDVPQAGIACTIDIGMMYDIHPKQKVEVGRRLAHEAMRLGYGRKAFSPGPSAAEVKAAGGEMRVLLANIGEGLYAKGGKIGKHLFALAGEDGQWCWADARLNSDNTISVFSGEVAKPVAVRYAYYDCPREPNLYRCGDDLPVFPFCCRLP